MNRVNSLNSSNDFGHDDSTINIVMAIITITIIITVLVDLDAVNGDDWGRILVQSALLRQRPRERRLREALQRQTADRVWPALPPHHITSYHRRIIIRNLPLCIDESSPLRREGPSFLFRVRAEARGPKGRERGVGTGPVDAAAARPII